MKLSLTVLVFTLFSRPALGMDDCFWRSDARGFTQASDTQVVVQTFQADYRLQLGMCMELPFATEIGFDTTMFNYVCAGDRLLVMDNFNKSVKSSCPIFRIERM